MPDGKRKQLKIMIDKLIKKWVKFNLIYQQKKKMATFEYLENYLTNCILKGDGSKKNGLIEVQNNLNEAEKFLKFLQQ